MQKMFGAWLASMLLSMLTYGQAATETPDYTRTATIGVQFFLNDYKTAKDIRATSLSTVLDKKQFGKIKEMSPGLAIFYMKGINNHLDYSVTASGSFVDYNLQNRTESAGTDKFLLEVDASVIGKMVTDKYWVIPTVNLGVGASKYGSYYGAFIPAGVGLQVNFFDEAYLLINSQYRVPITETANYHFYHSIGIAGTINKKDENSTGKLKARPEFPMVAR
jgi:OmpA-OmpF porin, OOP family